MIQTVLPDGPAAAAGLHGKTGILGGYGVGGDVIVAIDGAGVLGAEGLISELAARKPGETAEVEVMPCKGEAETVIVTLGGREDDRSGMSKTEAEVERNAHREEVCDQFDGAYSPEACRAIETERQNDGQAKEEEQQERASIIKEATKSYDKCESNLHYAQTHHGGEVERQELEEECAGSAEEIKTGEY